MGTNYNDNKNIMIVFVCLRFLIFFIITQDQSILQEIFKNFLIFLPFFEYFQTFSNVFERFFLAYFTQTLQINPAAPILSPKTNVAPKNNLQKPYFSLNHDIFSPISLTTNLQSRPEIKWDASVSRGAPFRNKNKIVNTLFLRSPFPQAYL